MTTDTADRTHVAIHEAGHAVVAAVLGIPLTHVSIVREEWSDSEGRCAADPWDLPAFDHHEQDTFAAGGAVAQVLAGDAGGYEREHARRDMLGVIRSAMDRHGVTTEADVSRVGNRAWDNATRAAERILAANWPAVINVAAMLLRERLISGESVVAAVKRRTATP